MSDPFHATRRGATFFDHTMPSLVAEIARLNETLERIATALETKPPTKEKDA